MSEAERARAIRDPDVEESDRVPTTARGFAYLWLPGQYLRGPHADVVLSVALDRHDPSPRFKEVVEPAPGRWMHHLELDGPDEVDAEVVEWLREAASQAE